MVARQTGESQRRSYAMLNAVLGAMADGLAAGETIELRDFGVFRVIELESRRIAVPGRGRVQVGVRRDVRFYGGRKLNERINED